MYPVRILHRFWAGSEMPEKYKEFGAKWAALNPEWRVKDWGINAINLLPAFTDLSKVLADLDRRDAGRKGIEYFVQLADVLGYFLVWKYGGVYVNCDIEPLQPIEPFLPSTAWASKENDVDDRIVNAAIGAPNPNNEFWSEVLRQLPDRYFADPSGEMVMTTGPQLLTDIAHQRPGELYVFPTAAFNSVHWSKIPDGGDATGFAYPESAIAVHHWGHKKDHRSNHVETATQR
jgi:mannosyltransferase OCH1-like enzyme